MDWGIIGHKWAVNMLKEHVVHNKLRHAYLLTGAQGVGRRTLAIALAQTINCLEPPSPGEPCFQCRSCRQLQELTHPDLSIVQAEDIGGVLKVDQIRELQHSLALTPYEGRYRIAILLRFEEAHNSASNALLKTLEEPNPQVVILLTASSPEVLLPTIVSRCELLRLRPPPIPLLEADLANQFNVPAKIAKDLAHISNGRPGIAIDMLNSPENLQSRKDDLDDLIRMLSSNRLERFAYAESLAGEKVTVRKLLTNWVSFWRDVLLSATQTDTPLTNIDYTKHIKQVSDELTDTIAYQYIAQTEQTLDLISRNVNLRLALEVLLLDLPHISISNSA